MTAFLLPKKLAVLREERGSLCLYRVEAKEDKHSETRKASWEGGLYGKTVDHQGIPQMSPIFKGTSKGNAAQTLLPFGCFLSFYLISHSLGCSFQFNSAHSVVSDSVTPWTAHPASLSITNSWSLLKLMSIRLVMPSNHLIFSFPSPPTFNLSQHQCFPMSQFFILGGQSIAEVKSRHS